MHRKSFEQQHVGSEPKKLDENEIDLVLLGKYYQWYGYFCKAADSKKYTLAYLKAEDPTNPDIKTLQNVRDQKFGNLGWICRMLTNGIRLPAETLGYKDAKIKELVSGAVPVAPREHINIQSAIIEKVHNLLGDIESQLDRKDPDVDYYKFMNDLGVKPLHAVKIVQYYQPLMTELTLAVNRSNPEVNEYYSHVSRANIKTSLEQVKNILVACKDIMSVAKQTRSPRMPKPKSASKIVAKMKFKVKDDDFRIASIPPENIVGSQQLWVFNTKTHKLGQYFAEDNSSLSVKGTTIIGFDTKKSSQKTLRKPEKVLTEVLSASKIALRKTMDGLTTKGSPLTGRINEDTILLRTL